jgi:hypothetical protein
VGIQRAVEWMLRHPPTADDPMGRLDLDYRAEDAIPAPRAPAADLDRERGPVRSRGEHEIADLVATMAARAGAGRVVAAPADDLPESRAVGIQRAVEWMLRHPPTADDPMGRLDLDYRAEDAILATR